MRAALDLFTFFVATGGLLIICKAWVKADYREIKEATGVKSLGKTWHRQRLIYKALSVLALCFIFAVGPYTWLTMLMRAAAYGFFVCWFWWALFDRWLSLRRKLSLFYIGKSAGSDQLLRAIQVRFNLSDQYTHNRVKLPGLILSLMIVLATVYFTNY